jgi:hypothetical protein
LAPVQEGCELDSLDSVGNSETLEQTVKMGLNRASRHLQFAGNLGIVAALQQEIGDLLLPRTQANGFLLHCNYSNS